MPQSDEIIVWDGCKIIGLARKEGDSWTAFDKYGTPIGETATDLAAVRIVQDKFFQTSGTSPKGRAMARDELFQNYGAAEQAADRYAGDTTTTYHVVENLDAPAFAFIVTEDADQFTAEGGCLNPDRFEVQYTARLVQGNA